MINFLLILISFVSFAQKPDLLLLKKYKNQDITNWVMSEKLDGIRGYWNGKNLISRGGNIIYAPKWFIKNYPPFEIDGELWSKRGDFYNISSIVRDKVPSKDWLKIKHYIFEVPNAGGNLFNRLSKVEKYKSNIIKIIPQLKIQNKKHLQSFLNSIESQGGEGVVVRDPYQLYINKRTNKALKVKTFYDSECEVIAHNEGLGKFTGMLGSLTCRLKNEVEFKVGSGFSNKERNNPPKIGDIITFKYKEWTSLGKPRFPTFVRIKNKF